MPGTRFSVFLAIAGLLTCMSSAQAAQVDRNFTSRVSVFGFKTLNELARTQPGKNVFISPVSLEMALTMTYNGASGETRKAMAQALELTAYTPQDASAASSALIKSLENSGPGVKLNIANSLWARKGVKFKPDFLRANKNYFNAEIKEVEFDQAAVKAINSWVSSKTQGKIPKIIEQIQSNMILFLINAVYFKGQWTDEFDKKLTKEAPFTLANGTKTNVPMMSRHGHYTYFSEPGLQAISIPYGTGRMSMYVFLPDKPSGLPDLLLRLNATTWEKWMHSFGTRTLDLSMPRFKIEYKAEEELKAALKSMGMTVAFDPAKADFSGMAITSHQNLYISQIVHKTYVDVNEQGTEAAAVTSVGVGVTAMPVRPLQMVIDHPFLCAIADNDTGAILFIGAITNPKQ
jgi:serpin B